jgi:hypothetical protein
MIASAKKSAAKNCMLSHLAKLKLENYRNKQLDLARYCDFFYGLNAFFCTEVVGTQSRGILLVSILRFKWLLQEQKSFNPSKQVLTPYL